jgi:hypothetical protein
LLLARLNWRRTKVPDEAIRGEQASVYGPSAKLVADKSFDAEELRAVRRLKHWRAIATVR